MKPEKEFLVKDLSGRGMVSKLSESHLRQHWELSEQDDYDTTLWSFLEDSQLGDSWKTRTVEITRI